MCVHLHLFRSLKKKLFDCLFVHKGYRIILVCFNGSKGPNVLHSCIIQRTRKPSHTQKIYIKKNRHIKTIVILIFYSIKLSRLVQEGFLKVLLVYRARVDAQHHEHLAGIAYGEPVDHLAAALAGHQLQQRLPQVVADAAVADHL